MLSEIVGFFAENYRFELLPLFIIFTAFIAAWIAHRREHHKEGDYHDPE